MKEDITQLSGDIDATDLQLWFGDERGYNATDQLSFIRATQLWFGDERGYNATCKCLGAPNLSCGLVMKEDITQQKKMQI